MSYLDLGGTVRSQTTTETLKKITALFSRLGITRVANVTGLDNIDIPVAICIRPNSKHLSTSQGKGLTWELAQISAIMESIEGYHAENVDAPIMVGAYTDLIAKHPIVDPQVFATGAFNIPKLDKREMGWVAATDLITQQINYIPHSLLCMNSTKLHPEYAFFNVSSNGLAAGNTLDEALCHALYEIIERDSLCRWALLPVVERQAYQLQLDTIDSHINQELLLKLKAAKQLVKIWDITSLFGIPTYHCVIYDTHPFRRLGIFSGTGTHLFKEVALSRAITEAAQSRLTLISGSRDDVFSDHYHQRLSLEYPLVESDGSKNFQERTQLPVEEDFTKNGAFLLHQLSSNEVEQILLYNHTNPLFNIPLVHVFIPSLKFNGRRI